MKCSYFNKELDEDRKIGYVCSCEFGYFESENQNSAVDQFCSICEDKESDSNTESIDDEEDDA